MYIYKSCSKSFRQPKYFIKWLALSVIKRHQASSNVVKHHQLSSSIFKCHQASSSLIKHHQVSLSIIKHHKYCFKAILKKAFWPPPQVLSSVLNIQVSSSIIKCIALWLSRAPPPCVKSTKKYLISCRVNSIMIIYFKHLNGTFSPKNLLSF